MRESALAAPAILNTGPAIVLHAPVRLGCRLGRRFGLGEASGGRSIDREALLDGFLARLETRVAALRGGYFDVAGWTRRQSTSGRLVRLELPDGTAEVARAVGVDATTGALVVAGPGSGDPARQVVAGEIRHLGLAELEPAADSAPQPSGRV